MDRETITIETPISKAKVQVKTYLTGRERRAITDIYLSSGVEFDPETKNIKNATADLINKVQDIAWSTVIVSINGSTENILETILDMHSNDTDFLTLKVNEIVENKNFEQKKTI